MGDPRAVVEQLNEAINAKDLGRCRQCYAAGARLVTAGGRHLDIEGLDKLMAASFAAFPDLSVTTVRSVVEGDVVVTEEVMEGTHVGHFAGIAPTGRRVRLPMAHVTKVLGERIVERVAYHDTASLLRQLAAEDQPA